MGVLEKMENQNEVINSIDEVINSKELIKEVNNVVNTKIIYIFGSYARGEQRKDSDIDIYIVALNFDERKLNIVRKIRERLIKITDKPMDILVNTEEDFEQRVKTKATLEYIVSQEGVKIYG